MTYHLFWIVVYSDYTVHSSALFLWKYENFIYLRLFSVLPRAVPVTTGVVSGPLHVGGQNEGRPSSREEPDKTVQ